MTKVALFSDIHVNNWKQYSTVDENGINSRLKDGINCITQIRKYCISNKINIVLFGGDLFHIRKNIFTNVYNQTYDALKLFKQYNIEAFLLPGNHDQADKDGNIHALHGLKDVCTVLDTFGSTQIHPRINLFHIPYAEDKEYITSLLSNFTPISGINNLLLAHMNVSGAQLSTDFIHISQYNPTINDLYTFKFDFCFFGHYHKFQYLNNNSVYIGSPLAHNWSDKDIPNKGFLVYDLETKTIEQVLLDAPKFVEAEYDSLVNMKLNELLGNICRIKCDTELHRDEIEDIRTRYNPYALEIVVNKKQVEVAPRMSINSNLTTDDVLKYYIENSNTKLDSNKLLEIAQELLKTTDEV